jgi:cytochrome b involved in lipid metabolism
MKALGTATFSAMFLILTTACDRKDLSPEAEAVTQPRPTPNNTLSSNSGENLQPRASNENPTQPNEEPAPPADPTFTAADVALHNTKADCWIIIEDSVYDITNFFSEHPGGQAPVRFCGKDATAVFARIHAGSTDANTLRQNYRIGRLAL